MSIIAPASACPSCRRQIRPYDNIPVLSWFILRGRCRHCATPISPRYVLVEAFLALLFVGCYARFGLTVTAAKFCVLSFLLLGLIFTDAEWKLLPDSLTLPGIFAGIAFSLLTPVNDIAAVFLPALNLPRGVSGWRAASLEQSVTGVIIGAAFIYGAGALYSRARGHHGMGMGDVKLMAMVGAFLGSTLTVVTIFAASIAGSIFGLATIAYVWEKRWKRQIERRRLTPDLARRRAWRSAVAVYRHYQLPFGVFLGGVGLMCAFYGRQMIAWYGRVFFGL
jgi:leader peptidase (prepilin peptidase)/N-methyltransferase